jgi:hypothetical protein
LCAGQVFLEVTSIYFCIKPHKEICRHSSDVSLKKYSDQ